MKRSRDQVPNPGHTSLRSICCHAIRRNKGRFTWHRTSCGNLSTLTNQAFSRALRRRAECFGRVSASRHANAKLTQRSGAGVSRTAAASTALSRGAVIEVVRDKQSSDDSRIEPPTTASVRQQGPGIDYLKLVLFILC